MPKTKIGDPPRPDAAALLASPPLITPQPGRRAAFLMPLAGLATCHIAVIPFFGKTVLGDGYDAATLFAALALTERPVPAIRERPFGALSPAN
jgi:hypothetical protein